MATIELRPGGTQSRDAATLPYVMRGIATDDQAYLLLVAFSPAIHAGLYRRDCSVDHQGAGVYYGTATYGQPDKKEPEAGDWEWGFDTTGGTRRITQSLETLARYVPSGKTAVNHRGAINVTETGVEGVDVIDRSFKWTENHKLLLASYGWAYSQTIADLTGKVNAATFRGFAAGTVLFAGGSGKRSAKDADLLDMTYNFEHSRAVTGLTVGTISGVAKPGWAYAWVEYEKEADATAGKLASPPSQVNVERVYDAGDFSLLGLGS